MPRKQRILFVDDEPAFLEGLRHALHRQRGEWEMVFLRDPEQALERALAEPFDTVVVDVRMSGRSGLDLLRSLREAPATRDVPVIVLTGCGDRDLKRRALDLGAADLLGKPVHREDLLARLRSVLRLKAQQDELKALNENLEGQVAKRVRELKQERLEVIWRLAKAGEFRDEMTGQHVVRVSLYCRELARRLGRDEQAVETIFLTSSLHDIGKIGVPDRILLKPGELNEEEWRVMQTHCEIGARILLEDAAGARLLSASLGTGEAVSARRSRFLQVAASIALGHHERWDGRGYPRGLAGAEIPLEARIVALADTYDAMCSDRPYRPAREHSRAVEVIRGEAGRQFDPEVCAAFESLTETFLAIRAEQSHPQGQPEALPHLLVVGVGTH